MPPDTFTAARNALAAYDAHEAAKQQLVSARAFAAAWDGDSQGSDIVSRKVRRDAGTEAVNTGHRRHAAMETLRATLAATGTTLPAGPDTEASRPLSDALRALEVRSATRDFASGITDPEAPDFGALTRQAEAIEAALYHLRVAARWAAVAHRTRPGSTEADAAMARLASLTTNPTAPQGG